MAKKNILTLDTNHPCVVIKPVKDGKEVKCYHIEAWLTFEEFNKINFTIDTDLAIEIKERPNGSGYYKGDGTEITIEEINDKMLFLSDTASTKALTTRNFTRSPLRYYSNLEGCPCLRN